MPRTVVVVDDDPEIRELVVDGLTYNLAQKGYEVKVDSAERAAVFVGEDESKHIRIMEFDDGKPALAAISKMAKAGDPPSLLISDGDMPIMGGIELSREVHELTTDAKIPVLILSGTVDKEFAQKAKAVDAKYFKKPHDINNMFSDAMDIIENGGLHAASVAGDDVIRMR